jgi:hypothetical protein
MSLLDRFRRKPPADEALRDRLVELVMRKLTERTNRIRTEDAICGAAAIVGERCIDLAAAYPLRDHNIPPGRRVFSDRVNDILCGNITGGGFDLLPTDSIFGQLHRTLNPRTYQAEHFPELGSVFSGYAAGFTKAEDWGHVPVTVPALHHPTILPLQFAYETRSKVDSILAPVATEKERCLRIAVLALADILNHMSGAMPPAVAILLALELTNGMAKTAPMTDRAMREGG